MIRSPFPSPLTSAINSDAVDMAGYRGVIFFTSFGTAAAVADFMAPVAFGSQTAGSVIRPAAYCGTVFWYWFTQGIPDMWKPFAWIDLVFAVCTVNDATSSTSPPPNGTTASRPT